mmetsp:Transcript_69800/g.102282  ORF Transcript_69800/g.102282 Transcript_69800/m.102282 type:complete len:95 (+) Transcript_69800:46-330(+)
MSPKSVCIYHKQTGQCVVGRILATPGTGIKVFVDIETAGLQGEMTLSSLHLKCVKARKGGKGGLKWSDFRMAMRDGRQGPTLQQFHASGKSVCP